MSGYASSQDPQADEALPDVTVVVPTRDRVARLRDAIASVRAQRDVSVEIVVVDDASTDGTRAWLAAENDDRIRLVAHDRRLGVARARNAGIALARGHHIAFLDDDDVWAPDKLRAQLAAMRHEDAGFAYSSALLVDDAGLVVHELVAPPAADLAVRLLAVNVVPAGSSNVVVKRSLLDRVGGFDERLRHLDDWDMWIRLAVESRAAACVTAHVGYRQHPANRFVAESHALLREFDALAEKHAAAAARLRTTFDRQDFSRYVATSLRRSGRRAAASRVYAQSAWRHRSAGDGVRAVATALGERVVARGRSPLRAVAAPSWVTPFPGDTPSGQGSG